MALLLDAINWTTVEDAIYAWVEFASGLDPDRIIWAGQSGPRPATPYITIEITVIQTSGHDWYDADDAAVPSAGAEIEYKARGNRVATVVVQAISDESIGSLRPSMILNAVKSGLSLPTRVDALNAAGLGLSETDDVTALSVPRGTFTEPRALLNARFHLASQVSEYGTYIQTADITEDPPIS